MILAYPNFDSGGWQTRLSSRRDRGRTAQGQRIPAVAGISAALGKHVNYPSLSLKGLGEIASIRLPHPFGVQIICLTFPGRHSLRSLALGYPALAPSGRNTRTL